MYDPDLLPRFFGVDASREKNIPLAMAAIIFHGTVQLKELTGGQSNEFTECFKDKDTQIFCSNELAPQGRECARSLYEESGSFDTPGLARKPKTQPIH